MQKKPFSAENFSKVGNPGPHSPFEKKFLNQRLIVSVTFTTRASKTDTDSKKTDTDTIFPNYPGYTDNGYTDIY